MMKKLLILMLLIVSTSLASCADTGGRENGGGIWKHGEENAKLPKFADYGTGDVEYTAELSDGKRVVTLEVKRTSGVSVATVTSPDELAGALITDDTEGMRILLKDDCELPVSAEASAGLAVVFALYLPIPEEAKVTNSGEVRFTVGEYTARLKLTEDGYPDTATVVKDGVERHVKFSRNKG